MNSNTETLKSPQSNSATSAIASGFATVVLLGHRGKGVLFEDGTVMLQRQGSSENFHVGVNGVGLEVRVWPNGASSFLFFEDGQGGPQHRSDGKYHRAPSDGTHPLPGKLVRDVLNRIELHTNSRPSGIRQQFAAYMFGWGSKETDLLLLRFRYDSETRTLIEAGTGTVVARLPETAGGDAVAGFDETAVAVLATDAPAAEALNDALRKGFHECDRKNGVDYCMRRLTWLASAMYEEKHAGALFEAFVLKADAESPEQLLEPETEKLAA